MRDLGQDNEKFGDLRQKTRVRQDNKKAAKPTARAYIRAQRL